MSKPYRRYLCRVCGFVYDEAEGDPDGGLPPGTRYEDIPDDWECPDCGVSKADFELLEEPDETAGEPVAAATARVRPGMDPEQIVVIGGGMAAWAFVETLRERDPRRPVLLIAGCDGDPYPKPQLSAAAAKGRSADDLVLERGADRAARLGVGFLRRTRVLGVDVERRRVITPRGGVPYGTLILATGAHQPQPSLDGEAAHEVMQVNDLASYRRFRERVDPCAPARVVIMGAGLIGCEFADDLAAAGHTVTLVDQASAPLARLLPTPASERLESALRSRGVALHTGTTVETVAKSADSAGLQVQLANGLALGADAVLSALGLQPNTGLAREAGIATDRGIQVDEYLRTSVTGIHAIGDCAEHDGRLLPYVRPLQEQARVLVANLCGEDIRYRANPGTVVIKTPSCPLAVWPPEEQGEWVQRHADEQGLVMEHVTGDRLTGFALAGAHARDASAFEARMG